jgi:hypothetical protein
LQAVNTTNFVSEAFHRKVLRGGVDESILRMYFAARRQRRPAANRKIVLKSEMFWRSMHE